MSTMSILRVVRQGCRRAALVAAALLLLSSCNQGGGEGPQPPTELPPTLTLTVPATERPPGAAITFSSNAQDPQLRLRYQWQFGDGQSDNSPQPVHAYGAAGDYTVQLTLTNEAGVSRSGVGTVSISGLTGVRGKLCNRPNLAGWCWQRPLPQGDLAWDVAFVDAQRGWAVAAPGVVLATSDGGLHWERQFPPTERWLKSVSFPSAQVGWALSTEGSVLRTVDGGSTWLLAQALDFGPFPSGIDGRVFEASDGDHVVVGTSNGLFVTTDAGNRWQPVIGPDGAACRTHCKFVAGGPVAWASAGALGPRNALARSLDSGRTWADVPTGAISLGPDQGLELAATDAATAVVAVIENSLTTHRLVALWQTTDAGASWRALNRPPVAVCSVRMFDADTLFCVGSSAVLRSTDRGASWQRFDLPSLVDAEYRIVNAQVQTYHSPGAAYLTQDAGAHWRLLGLASTSLADWGEVLAIKDLWFFDPGAGLALDNDGRRWLTADGGQRWARVEGAGPTLSSTSFLRGSSLAWAVSSAPTQILRSEDRGHTWLAPAAAPDPPLGFVSGLHFTDASNGWLVSRSTTTGQSSVYRSADGGRSWQPAAGTNALRGLFGIAFGDLLHGVAAGQGGAVLVTSDGGASWSTANLNSGFIVDLAFADARTVIAIDSRTIYRSVDGGRTWSAVLPPVDLALSRVRFSSAKTGHIVGERGTLLQTTDGGASWSLQPTGTVQGLQAVYFADERNGWIAGSNGSILATVTNGR